MLRKITLFNLFVCCFLAFSSLANAQGEVIIDIQDKEEPTPAIEYKKLYDEFLSEIAIVDENYPGSSVVEGIKDFVAEKNITDDASLQRFNEKSLYLGVKARRLYKQIKSQIQKFIIENDIPIQFEDSDFATPETEEYQESDQLVVREDFKKVISNSSSDNDILAMENVKNTNQGISKQQKKALIKKAFLAKDWKSLLSYLLYDGKPVDDKKGIGEWEKSPLLQARLVLENKTISSADAISGTLQLYVPKNRVILLRDYDKYSGLRIDFSASKNISDIKINYTIPQRFFINLEDSLVGYSGFVSFPIVITPKNPEQPIEVSAEINASSCLNDMCPNIVISPKLKLEVGNEKEPSLAAPFLRILQYYAPQPAAEDLKLLSLNVEETSNGNILQLKAVAKKTPAAFQVYIEGEGAEKFLPPLIRVDGTDVIARFIPLDPQEKLVGQKFSIVASVAPDISVRSILVAQALPLFSTNYGKISLGLLGIAFIGGLLLNVMPCVFPVLALKIMSFGNFGNSNISKIRRDFIYNVLGIMVSFAILIIFLVVLKLLGHSIGWGMQFQNFGFLVFMIFVIAGFIAHLWGLIHFSYPEYLEKIIRCQHSEAAIQFFNGVFLVLLATPCTAPYLGTALGIALSGTPSQIAAVVAMVGLGLSAPYILFALAPSLSYFMPRPGKWLHGMKFLMFVMLFLTLLWLLSILSAQTNVSIWWKYAIYIICFWFVLYLRRISLYSLEAQTQNEEPYVYINTRRILNIISSILSICIFVMAYLNTASAAQKHKQEVLEQRSQIINMTEIKQQLSKGDSVLLKIGADWCLTCSFNNITAFDTPQIKDLLKKYKISIKEVDWTEYQADVLQFMQKFGRSGLPFYILFTPRMPDGMVLPEIVGEDVLSDILKQAHPYRT